MEFVINQVTHQEIFPCGHLSIIKGVIEKFY